ncbi:hypothetical protein U9M48_003801 [Paspalum notatum var. saurae]|uniref:Uncharacterized protein n=1 Tax=Paspalum notatum var. saurae TaxID=547442 RepID=A0AAQ3PNN8_PASNO
MAKEKYGLTFHPKRQDNIVYRAYFLAPYPFERSASQRVRSNEQRCRPTLFHDARDIQSARGILRS